MYKNIGGQSGKTSEDLDESVPRSFDRKAPFDKIIAMSAQGDSENSYGMKQEENDKSVTGKMIREWDKFSEKIIWKYFIYLTFFHVGCVAALSSYLFGLHSLPMKRMTVFWMFFYGYLASFGVTAGAHRLWTHRSFKAKLPLKILLMILYCSTGLYSLRVWIRDHRQHHKYTDTDLDPHDSSRGLFYSHWSWLFLKRSPECIRTGEAIQMNDIRADPVVMFQHKHHMRLMLIFCFLLPTAVPIIFWGESILHAVLSQCFIRYVIQLNMILSVNSLAHYWGYRPYDRSISAVDNPLISVLIGGEATHNYHHTFPWDYKATEFPYMNFNLTAVFIRVMASLGLAYDLKEASPELVEKLKEQNGCDNLTSNSHSD